MASNQVLDDIAEKIAGSLRLLGGAKQEAQSQIRNIVETALQQFDVVTDERMQVQEAMLEKARADMKALEERIRALEDQLKNKHE
ncbi:MAG: 3-octaprenyl-4-hydroxybenzoate carboxy-lyase [Zetaproteobacteria bacterium CG_4_9_14_3_um_filter_49_83]|nr:MAG: 3-octaprenyl-4-hydroxybenzoate carboxy-lyase [Zetaproteobacteria bacterium CG1_02_49_23]PIQ30069.1 MAG: 3-octaprenyl-4-hydroxybenzoate carboxy-lyase [Zetaproteobacteria bacterium CG17_big_fil_post_rev_8_21_14_2_50_50_13]PIV29189.1 MAG: 3-octaprenyl-4-hydroxybenzoate carboxy-lyase [Zetaproteobacteria bacterium CG02_land_8_20_14_3_00_50_9]PIY55983.1 MAG: 3-octaprenyl-4-hydroxybenzoate carboxy-lyase [Zetaproteobacteria bacterium CG_4_10_14_0_8_um_filter_49_80]PJA36341.1 MAG: 3-octaprenyl-4